MIFLVILCGIPLLSVLWWAWADWRLRRLGVSGWWRLGPSLFSLVHLGGFVWLMVSRFSQISRPPEVLLAGTYVWGLVVLPLTIAATLLIEVLRGILTPRHGRGAVGGGRRAGSDVGPGVEVRDEPPAAVTPVITRRQALAGLGLVGAPMLAQGAAVARGLSQLDEFRVREIVVDCPTLPPALDGLTIAHVSDTHVGRFTRGAVLDAVAGRVNELGADLVCFTGDLIDYTLADLPEALAMARQFRARHGVFSCEGNHDLFEGREQFRRAMDRADVGFMVNDAATVTIRGHRVQLLGLRWGADGGGRGALFDANAEKIAHRLDPGAFQILLAHHPHAFDDAARLGIPLTLSGHTHGGQLNIAEGRGPVQAWFKYMSGLYRQPGARGVASCVVSNGVGNWFPLRVNAPAEVVRVTLRGSGQPGEVS